jgi:hypothetical protein
MVGVEGFAAVPLGVILTVDREGVLRMYSVNGEMSELILKSDLDLDGVQVSCLYFFPKAKTIVIATEDGKGAFLLTSERDLS